MDKSELYKKLVSAGLQPEMVDKIMPMLEDFIYKVMKQVLKNIIERNSKDV